MGSTHDYSRFTHDFRAARCTFWVLYKPKGRIWYIPLTITHDYSRFLFCSVCDLTLQCVVTMRAHNHFFLMCHMKTHSSRAPCLNKFEKGFEEPLVLL